MSIAENRRARYDYHIAEQFEAGLVLEGGQARYFEDVGEAIAVHEANMARAA